MNAEIQFVDMDTDAALEQFVQKKLDQLGDKHDWVIYAHVFLREIPHPELKNKTCEIRLSSPGPLLYAHEARETFENAISDVINQLEIQLEKRKSKMHPYI